MILINVFKYRPEIDGLRALAVLSVLFYHVGLGFPGGFVGVDIFFVISGYLITSLIIKEIQEDRFSFSNFYARRIRRIIPAGSVMVLVTYFMGWFLLLPSDFIALGKSVISQTIFSSNIYFWRYTNYFAESADLQPLLHTWSLAVEEQFYMIMPFLLWGLLKFLKIRSRMILVIILLFIFFVSLILSIYALPKVPSFTFYLLPTRAWELLLGSVVALIPPLKILKRPAFQEFLVVLGFLGMILPVFFYTEETLFPGINAIPPCLGTALFIIGSSPQGHNRLPFAAKIFTWRPIVFIGLISYSLYLWHWPLVAFSHYWALDEFSTIYKWGIVASSFLLAVASWRYVETPLREKKIFGGRRATYSYAVVMSLSFILASLVVYYKNGFSERFGDKILALDKAKSEALVENRISSALFLEDAKAGNFPTFGRDDSQNINVLVWGDSHARSILPAVIEAAGGNHIIGSAWNSGTAPVLDYIPPGTWSLGDLTPAWTEAIVEQVCFRKIPNVILAAKWSGYFKHAAGESGDTDVTLGSFKEKFLNTVRSLVAAGTRVYILREVPNHEVPVPKALAKEQIFGADLSAYMCSKEQLKRQNKLFDSLKKELELAGATILDASPSLLDESREKYLMNYDRTAFYYDSHHLTRKGAQYVAETFTPIFSQSSTEEKIVVNNNLD